MKQGLEIGKEQKEEIKKGIVNFLKEKLGATFESACKENKISPAEAYTWRKEEPQWDKEVVDALWLKDERMLDFSESKMFERINGIFVETKEGKVYQVPPSDTLIMYHTSRKGKHRGYAERKELTGKEGETLFKPAVVQKKQSRKVSDEEIEELSE